MGILMLLLINVNYWATAYGTSGQDECGSAIEQTLDGGYIIAGTADYYGDPDGLIIKVTSVGDKQWAKQITGSYVYLYSVHQTLDGGYVACGEGDGYAVIVKLNSSGTVTGVGGFKAGSYSSGEAIEQTSDGYIMVGTTSAGAGNWDVLVIKFNSGLGASWGKTYGGTGYELGRAIKQTSDGGYLIGGQTNTSGWAVGDYDFLVIKTDGSGTVSWANAYGGTKYDGCFSVTSDYLACGVTKSFVWGNEDALVIKLDSANGSVSWAKNYGKPGGYFFGIKKIVQAGTGYAICGEQNGTIGLGFTLFGLTSTGGLTSLKKLYDAGLMPSGNDWEKAGRDVDYTTDGGYVMAGACKSPYGCGGYDFFVLKTDANGLITTTPPCDLPNDCCPPQENIIAIMTVTNTGLIGATQAISGGGFFGSSNPTIIETDVCVDPFAMEERKIESLTPALKIIPTISRVGFQIQYVIPEGEEKVSLKIYDSAGKLIKTLFEGYAPPGSHIIDWQNTDENGKKVKAGTYFCEFRVDGKVTKKMVTVE